MEVVKLKQADQINIIDIEVGHPFEFNGENYIRTATASTVVVNESVMQNVIAVNLENGTYLFLGADVDTEVFAVLLPTAKVVVE